MAVFTAIGTTILGAALGGGALATVTGLAAVGAVGAGVNKISQASEATQRSATVQAEAAQTRVQMQ